MKRAIIALLLSALIFPGLGQLYNRDLKKGLFLVLLATLGVTVFFLGGLILLNYEYAARYPAPLDRELLKELLWQVGQHPVIVCAFGLLLGVWIYAVLDAFRTPLASAKKE